MSLPTDICPVSTELYFLPVNTRMPLKFGGETVTSGAIIVRQRGTRLHPGTNVGLGRDFTLYATIDGRVTFEWAPKGRRRVSVYPIEVAAESIAA